MQRFKVYLRHLWLLGFNFSYVLKFFFLHVLYRKETDLWAEFGRRVPFGKRFSSKHSVKTSVVGSTSSFGRRDVFTLLRGSIRECMMTWHEYKEETN
jgi:hypothetical protein